MDNENKKQQSAPEASQTIAAEQEQETTQPVADDEVEVMDVTNDSEEDAEVENLKNRLADTQAQLEKEKKEYLFLAADFDNFRKRTLKEKSELIRNAAESALKGILPIVDDFERGLDAIKSSTDADAVKEGMELIYKKLIKYLEQNGVKPMESTGADFDADLHEAVAAVPGPEEQKGKVIDTIQKGYMINDKVLRHAKVAVGQ